jgi:hypothetical protein
VSFVKLHEVNAVEHFFALLCDVKLRLAGGSEESVLHPPYLKDAAERMTDNRERTRGI